MKKCLESWVSALLASPRTVLAMEMVIVLAAMLAGTDALARAGGGEAYSGAGGGGDGGGSGSEGDLLLLELGRTDSTLATVLLVLLAIGMLIRWWMNPDSTTSRAVKRLERTTPPDKSGFANIASRDPGFNDQAFIARVKKVEVAVQTAWTGGSMDPARNHLSDGLFRRFQSQLNVMAFQGTRNVMADLQIHSCRVHAVEMDDHFDTIHVAIEASARDVQVPLAASADEAQAMAGRANLERYIEIWSFRRRPGARTLASGGALEGRCPSCGAPVGNVQVPKCNYCQALINSGDYDWVLAEITQLPEWRRTSTGAVAGLAEISARDPGFNRQVAEDRASYVFWRWMEAVVKGSSAPLAKCASRELIARTLEENGKGMPGHFKTAVGAVDLVQCESDGRNERYYARVRWSSARTPLATPLPSVSIMVLSRAAGHEDKAGFAYARCPGCSAPLS